MAAQSRHAVAALIKPLRLTTAGLPCLTPPSPRPRQVLVNDSARLQESYPTNAEHIADQQRLVVTSWDQLHQRAAQRKEELQASLELQRFLTQVSDRSPPPPLRAPVLLEHRRFDQQGVD